MSTVESVYTLTSDDLSRAFRLHYRAEMWRWPNLLAFAIALAILSTFSHIALPDDPAGVAIVLGCGVLGAIAVPFVMIQWAVPLSARRLYTRSKLSRAPVQLNARSSAVRFSNIDGVTDIPWADIVRWREDADTILLYYAPRLFHVVPRRALPAGARDALCGFYDHRGQARPDNDPRPDRDGAERPEATEPAGPVLAASRSWTVERADLVAAQRLHLRRSWRRPRSLLEPFVFAAIVGLITIATEPDPTWRRATLAMLVALLVMAALRVGQYALLPLGTRNFSRRQPNLGLVWRIELDAVGLRALTVQQDVRTPWSDYVAWAEDDRMLLIYRNKAFFQFMPLRACDADFMATFRNFVTSLPRL